MNRERTQETPDAGIGRRGFLQTLGAAGAMLALPRKGHAEEADGGEPMAVLVDTTRCLGCRNCEYVCCEKNGLPEPSDEDTVLDTYRNTSEKQYTVINRFETSKGEVFAKRQCMHCLQPACASACLTQAMKKQKEGPVIWRGEKCMGCRFCMVSCPFDVPKFEYASSNPKIQKCQMCWDRLQEGEQPKCVEECMGEALLFGKRSEILAEAHKRIAENPDTYVNHIYGEREAGGTSWLYLSSVPFEEIGFRTDLQDESYPALTKEFLYGVPVTLILVPSLLYGISNATRRGGDDHE